jgi:hypothetical protein
VLRRSSYLVLHMPLWLGTLAAGAAMRAPASLLEQGLERWAGIDPVTGTGGLVTVLLYQFLVVAPLEQGLCAATVAVFWRIKRMRMRAGLARDLETLEGVTLSVSAALGFAVVRDVQFLLGHGTGWLAVLRAAMALASFVLLASLWGFELGRHAHRGMSGREFSLAWLLSTLFTAVSDRMVFRGGVGTIVAMLPLVLSLLVVAWIGWRSTHPEERLSSAGRPSILTMAPAPSLNTIREAFRRHDRPITLRWISFGALVTTGMITAGVAAAVYLGHRLGLDFSAVDRADAGNAAIAPVALLGAGALCAFPGSGYLLARASGSRSVLEPAMGAALAMVLVLVFMGMLAPASVVFVIAFAPIAFALSCAGAWLGLGS